MKYFTSKFILLTVVFYSVTRENLFAQYSSKNNYRGNWETPATWVPVWQNPQRTVSGFGINVNGYITVNGSLSFSGSSGNLIVNDTLVVKGDLTLGDHNNLLITNSGVLIVWGNLYINRADIDANGYLVVVNDIVKTKQFNEGSFSSNQHPGRVFVGGRVPPEVSGGNTKYPALDCTKPGAYIYPNSLCRYGNLNDLAHTRLFDFYRSTCSLSAPTVSPSGSLSFCTGESVILTASAGKRYFWSNGSSSQSITITSAGSYTVRVGDDNLCLSAPSETVKVNVVPVPPKPVITPAGPIEICSGHSLTLTSHAATGNVWTTGEKTPSIGVINSGTYRVKVTGENGCKSEYSDAVQVTLKQTPETPGVSVSGALSFCAGDSVNLTAGFGFKHLWSNGATSQGIKVKESGKYSVVVISDWGCESAPSKLLEVNVHPLPKKPSIKVSPGLSICSGDTISLESDQAVGYIWSTGAITKSVSIFSEGDYHVKVTNEHGCSNFSDPLHIEFYPVPEVPLITASGPLTICSGDSVILKVGAGSEYIWSNGEKSSGISVKKPGNYSVRVKNSHGCLSETSPAVSVVVNALPQVSINSGEAVCINSAMEIAGVPTGGVFKVLDGAANIVNNLLIPSKLGNLLVEYTYTGLCSNSVTKNILVTDLPKAIPGPDQTLASSRDAKMQAALLPSERGEWALVSGSGEIWDIHSPVTQVSALGSGKNVFQWKVSKGDCVSVAEVTLTVDDFIIPSVITPNGDGENEFFYIDPAYGKVKLLIFNKWGRVEYQSDNYLNDWNGKSSKGVALPEDTYFCVLHFANGVVKKGSLLIKR